MTDLLDRLVNQNLDLLKSGNFSDAEIICRGRTWKVHKVILQSRCAWYEKAFANHWQEAQTGQIHLEEERPDEINNVLNFIYSSRYIPDKRPDDHGISPSDLGDKVSLWRTADFFLLSDLKSAVFDYLFDRLVTILRFFHDFKLVRYARRGVIHDIVIDKHDLDIFFIDLPSAVEKVYECPAARQLQKLFAIFVCGLREHLPDAIRQDLNQRIPAFYHDLYSVLTVIHFPQSTIEPTVAAVLEDPYVSVPERAYSMSLNKISVCSKCSSPIALGTNWACSGVHMTLDPFSFGTSKWCRDCASEGIKLHLLDILKAWS